MTLNVQSSQETNRPGKFSSLHSPYKRGNQQQDWRGLSRPAPWAAQYLPSRHSCWRGVDTDPHQHLQMRKGEPPAAQGSPLQEDTASEKPWAFEEAWARRLGPGASLCGHSARVGGASTPECPQNTGKAYKGQGRAGSPQPRQPSAPLSSTLSFQVPAPTRVAPGDGRSSLPWCQHHPRGRRGAWPGPCPPPGQGQAGEAPQMRGLDPNQSQQQGLRRPGQAKCSWLPCGLARPLS